MQTRELIARVRKIEIRTRKTVEDIVGGAYRSMFKGRGIEFSEVRAYSPDDDVRDIDWNVTARTGSPFVKKYVEERELTVILAVDLSPSVAFGSGAETKRDMIASVAALLSFSAMRSHDKVGLLLFSNQLELYLPPRSGRSHMLRLIRELVAREPVFGRKTDLNVPLEFLIRSQKKRAAVFLISDFADCGDYERNLKLMGHKHDVAAFRILDPLEERLPGTLPLNLADSETGTLSAFSLSAERYDLAQTRLANRTNEIFRHARVDFTDFRCGEDPANPLMRFFHSRKTPGRK